MKKGKFFHFKLILIASIFLNIAFIGGFAVKKIRASQIHKETRLAEHHKHTGNEQAGDCINHLCQNNPQFKKIFDNHKSYYHNCCNDLVQMKTKLLTQLKDQKIEPQRHQELNRKIQELTHDLHDQNHRHLLMLKKHLNQQEFASLIDHMIEVLEKQQTSTIATKPMNKKP